VEIRTRKRRRSPYRQQAFEYVTTHLKKA